MLSVTDIIESGDFLTNNTLNDHAMSTEELREILRRDLDRELELGVDALMEISTILAAREPVSHTPAQAWEQFCKHYLPEVLNEPKDKKIPES